MQQDKIKELYKTLEKNICSMVSLKKRGYYMKKIIIFLLISNIVSSSYMIASQKPYTNLKKEIGNHRLSTLSKEQVELISNILKNLTETERHHFFISFNHHYDMTNQYRQKTNVNINLSKLQYHESSRISQQDIDHIIKIAHKHATHY